MCILRPNPIDVMKYQPGVLRCKSAWEPRRQAQVADASLLDVWCTIEKKYKIFYTSLKFSIYTYKEECKLIKL